MGKRVLDRASSSKVLGNATAEGAQTHLFLEALGNELYQVAQLLTYQVARRRAKRQLSRKS